MEDIMIFEKIFTVLPLNFYAVVLAVTALYTIWMVILILLTKSRVRHLQYELYSTEDSIRLHQGCHIENLPLISEIFEASSRKLAYAYDKMIQVSVDFHQKRWIPNPSDFITVDTVLDAKTVKRVKGYGFLYFFFLGLFISCATILSGMYFFDTEEKMSACLALALLPLFLCVLFTVLFYIAKMQNMTAIENFIKSLVQTLSRKLPVFNDYNGLALLINQFLDYDRNMTKSVDRFSEQIDHFDIDGLTTAVTASIEKTLLESVAPSIERATNAIVTLSNDVIEKENAGMKDLALKFSTALSDELSYQLEPLIKQICEVANTLSNSKEYLDIASKSLDAYKQNALELQSITSKTLVEYEESKVMFSEDVHAIAGAFAQFNQSSVEYNEKVAVNQQQFESAAIMLKESMEEGYKSLRLLVDGIFVEARNAETQALDSQKLNESYLDTMKAQIDAFASEFAETNKELFAGLSSANEHLLAELSSTNEQLLTKLSSADEHLITELSTTISDFVTRQSAQVTDQQEKVGNQSNEMMQSMEKAARDIQASSAQIKQAFDELEAARIREEENAKNKKSGFFGRKG